MNGQTPQPQNGEGVFAAAQSGAQWALRALWDQHRRYVAVVLLAHKPNSVDVEDLLQEVAAALVSKIGTVREEAALLPWLRMVALNAARLAGRKIAARPVLSLDAMQGPGGNTGDEGQIRSSSGISPGRPTRAGVGGHGGPSDDCETRLDSGWMMSQVERLPDDYREPLLMRCIHDMSYRQIGEVMGLPETTVETRIARGRRMLRDLVSASEKQTESRRKLAQSPAGKPPSRI
ncbi:MAG: sigma-70 family RNA polymerase sigma factor [Phycisphaerales bacterium]|nr:sigma-70 family RNA polymerase sigma factor [Phycisphaerales bacterium]